VKIAVLGGGNGSLASALDLTEKGHQVRLWCRDVKAVDALLDRNKTLELKDHEGQRSIALSMVTNNIAKAIAGVELIICPTPATAQEDIADELAAHLVDGQVVFLPPGSFGSFVMAKRVVDSGNQADVAFAEAGTLPYLTRTHGSHTVAITTRATRLPTGVFPLRLRDYGLKVIRHAFASVEDAGDGLSGALMNAGPIIHPPLIIMNAGPIEHFPDWDIHNEGTQPAVRRVTTLLDAERISIREELGYSAPHFPLADHYQADSEEWMYGNLAHEKLVDSGDWREQLILDEHRYMREDVAIGLALMVSIGDWLNVPTPMADSLLCLGSAICKDDFRSTGRTFENLELSQFSRAQMTKLLESGISS